MEKEIFVEKIIENSKKINIDINETEANKFYEYTQLLLEWNNKINLTAITEENDIILKHYIDSLTTSELIKDSKTIMDIGTGAGFLGIPLKIVNEEKEFVLVDSLNKRIKFLEEVKEKIELKNLELIHSRVEDLAKNKKYRENMDVVISRAVANTRVLVEYMLPFVRLNGLCICMKGPNVKNEIEDAKKAIEILGGKIIEVKKIELAKENIERNILIIKKVKNTPNKFPRKAGVPTKYPL